MAERNSSQFAKKKTRKGRSHAEWIPDRPSKRGAGPAPLGEVLVGAQSLVAQQTGAAMTQEQWRQIVGNKIAARTRVGSLRNKTLRIKVATSAWGSELSFLKSSMITKLQQSGYDVNDLRFHVDATSPWRSPRRMASATRAELPEQLRQQLAKVEDPNLRAAIAEAARWSLREKP